MIEEIRQRMARGQFEFSQDATDLKIFRKIRTSGILEMISTAEILEEYPTDKYFPSVLLLGYTSGGRPLHLRLTSPTRSVPKIITLYQPDPALWIDFRYRRATDSHD